MQNAEPLENLADQFARFPGIGRKGAVRMAYEVMSMSNEQAMELALVERRLKTPRSSCTAAAFARIIPPTRCAASALPPNGIVP